MPTVSVVIPVYNRGALIERTVASVLAQSLAPGEVEIVIVDDGSTDDTFKILESLYSGHAQIRLFSTANRGVAGARNFGLKEARGEFIAYLDHDDVWLPTKLEKQLTVLRDRPEVAVVYCNWRTDQVGETDPDGAVVESPPELSNPPQGEVFRTLQRANFLISMSLPMMRTAAVREVGGFSPRTVPLDDWDLWLRLAQRGEFVFLPEVLLLYTRHAEQQSKDNLRMLRATRAMLVKWWPALRSNPRAAWNLGSFSIWVRTRPRYDQARKALEEGRWGALDKTLVRALVGNPWILISPQWIYLVVRRLKRDASNFWR